MDKLRFVLLVLTIVLCDLYGLETDKTFSKKLLYSNSQTHESQLDQLKYLETVRDQADVLNHDVFIEMTKKVMKMIGDPERALSPLSTDGTKRKDWLEAIYGVLRTTHFYKGMPDLVASMGCKEAAAQQSLRENLEYQTYIKTLAVISVLGKKGWMNEEFYDAWEEIVQKNGDYTEDFAKDVFGSIEYDVNSLKIDLAFVQSVLGNKEFMKDVFYIHDIFAPHITLKDYFLGVLGGGLYHGWSSSGTDGQARWPYINQTSEEQARFLKGYTHTPLVSTSKASIVENTLHVDFLFVPRENVTPLSFSMKKKVPEDLMGLVSSFVYEAGTDKEDELKTRESCLKTYCNWTIAPYSDEGTEGYQRKFALLKKSVKNHPIPEIVFELGFMYENGLGVAKDEAEAAAWYRKAADQGYAWAQNNLGFMYQNGRGVAQNDVEAVAWYRKAADQGHDAAQNNLGFMYQNGRGVGENDVEAVAWYRKAADQGHDAAQHNLGFMYKNGRGVAQNDVEAVAWYRKAADQGHAWAQNNLGFMYENGRGVGKNDVEAVAWYRKAADQGLAQAQLNLGFMYENGRGVAKDEAEAVAWLRKAADQGHAQAQKSLGFMYENGRGVAKDEVEAVAWYRKAADQGHAQAQLNLGFMYQNGRGVAQNDVEAVAWYRKAADQGHADAQNNLGFMYENGRGVAKDEAEAVAWYRKAAKK